MKSNLKSWSIVLLIVWLGVGSLIGVPRVRAQGPGDASAPVTTPTVAPAEGQGQVTSSHRIYLPLVLGGASGLSADPDVEVTPPSLEETVAWGATLARTLTIANNGPGVLEFELAEIVGDFTPLRVAAESTGPLSRATPISVAIYDHEAESDISYWVGGNSNAWDVYQTILESDPEDRFEVTVVTDLSPATLAGFSRLILPDNAVPDVYLEAVSEWFTPGKRIVAVDSATCYAAYSGLMWPGSANSNGYETYWDYGSGSGDQEVIMADKITEDYTVGQVLSSLSDDAQMFSAGLPPDASQLTAKQSNHADIYVASREVPGMGTIVILGPFAHAVGNDLYALVRDAVEGEGGGDVPWLLEDVVDGSVPPHNTMSIPVTFDTSRVGQPGIYLARLQISSNDPDSPVVEVPVTMTAPPDPDMGKITGTVHSDRPGGALRGALVEVHSGVTTVISGTTDASGSYGPWWLTNRVYGMTVSADGYLPDTQDVSVSAGMTVTHDAALILNAPQVTVSPDSYQETLDWGERVAHTLTITNSGPSALEFELAEVGGQFTPAQVSVDVAQAVPLTPGEKVEAQVWDKLAAAPDGQTEFLVLFRDQADLRPAYAIRDWEERGEFVLQALRKTAASSQARALAQAQNFIQRGEAAEIRSHYIVNAMVVKGSAEVVETMAGRPEVAAVRALCYFPLPQPILGKEQPTIMDSVEWNIAQIGADQAWRDFGVRGEGIVVANIDTGVRYTHQALVNQYRGNQGSGSFDHNYNWWDPDMVHNQPTDENGHGTHTMGTMAGDDGGSHRIGVAPRAKWIAAQGCDDDWCSEADLISAAEWILSPWDLTGDRSTADPGKRPHVVNNSWGGGGGDRWYMSYVDAWRAAGIFPAFAIGNSGEGGCNTAGSPGDYPQSFGIGATDSSDVVAYFSSRGSSSFGGVKPNVSAPGVDVRSAYNSSDSAYYTASGTSMASPHLAGLVALMWSANSGLIGQVDETAQIIQQSALSIADAQCGEAGPPNNVYGWGRIDACQALIQVGGDLPWLITEPVTGTLPAYSDVSITVVFDASQIEQPGAHQATLRINSNDPYNAHVDVPVAMSVPPHPNMGKITGSVTSDRPGGALEGALVEITSGPTGVISGTTDSAGVYGPWWLMAGTYNVVVSAGDYLTNTQSVSISAGETAPHDLMLNLNAPQAEVTPPSFEIALGQGGVSRQAMTISNLGVGALTFEITETARALEGNSLIVQAQQQGHITVADEVKQEFQEATTQRAVGTGSGGPDPFGYIYRDSNEPGGPSYEWVEIAPPAGGSGTEMPLSGVDDGHYWPLSLPFNFNFYGTDYSTLAVASNGSLYFEDAYWGYSNGPIPSSNGSGVERFIAHLWDDLVVAPGTVYYQVEAGRVIIEYFQVSGYGSPGWGTWEVILFDNGDILFHYQDVTFDSYRDRGGSATVGIQGDVATGLQYSYNAAALFDGLAICFAYPGQSPDCSTYSDVPWLAEEPISGEVPAVAVLPVNVTIDATGLSPGVYTATLVVLTNDPEQARINVPVALNVSACGTSLVVDPLDQERVLIGGPFTVTTVISDATDLGGFEFNLGYDPTVVRVDDVALLPFLGSSGRAVYPIGPVIDNGTGAVSFGAFSAGESPGPSGTEAVALITLVPQAIGASALDVQDVQVTDTRGRPVPVCGLGGHVSVVECLSADFDCDCDVDIVDVMDVVNRWGCTTGESCYDPSYDLDRDGDLDIVDIMQVASYWGWTCTAAATFERQASASVEREATMSLNPANPTVEAGETLNVELLVNGAGDLGSFEFALAYDPQVVRVESVAMGDFLGSTGRDVHPLGPEFDDQAGRVRFGGFGIGASPGPSGEGILARIAFVAWRDGAPGLKLEQVQLTDVSGQPQPIARQANEARIYLPLSVR